MQRSVMAQLQGYATAYEEFLLGFGDSWLVLAFLVHSKTIGIKPIPVFLFLGSDRPDW